jgi:hypothetical protein
MRLVQKRRGCPATRPPPQPRKCVGSPPRTLDSLSRAAYLSRPLPSQPDRAPAFSGRNGCTKHDGSLNMAARLVTAKNALGRALLRNGTSGRSIYESQGIAFI